MSLKNKMEQSILIHKKAQAWSLDLMVAIMIFMMGISILFFYALNFQSQISSDINRLEYEANSASSLLLKNEEPGILSENKINQTKLEEFYYLNYSAQKSILGLENDFYAVMQELTINGTSQNYIGTQNDTAVNSIIKSSRVVIYQNKPIKFEVYVWK